MTFISLREAENYVEAFCKTYRLKDDTCFKTRLVIEELVTNMFKYTEAKSFTLNIAFDKHIKINLAYSSDIFAFKAEKPEQNEVSQIKEGGLGLFLVESMTRTFTYRHQDGKSIYTLTI